MQAKWEEMFGARKEEGDKAELKVKKPRKKAVTKKSAKKTKIVRKKANSENEKKIVKNEKPGNS